jgi:hypothetical protein
MLRITKNMGKINSMKKGDFPIDSFVIIPGVTQYKNIYTNENWLFFSQDDYKQSIVIEFVNEGELDRFFTMLMREIKLNQLINVETKNFK